MSVRLETTPWFTKNLAAGGVDTIGLLGHSGRSWARGAWAMVTHHADAGHPDPAVATFRSGVPPVAMPFGRISVAGRRS